MNKTTYQKGQAANADRDVSRGVSIVQVPANADPKAFEAFEREVNRVVASQPRLVIVDLSKADSVSTVSLGLILKLRGRATETGGKVILAGVQPLVRRVLDICRLDRLFTIVSSAVEAIAEAELASAMGSFVPSSAVSGEGAVVAAN